MTQTTNGNHSSMETTLRGQNLTFMCRFLFVEIRLKSICFQRFYFIRRYHQRKILICPIFWFTTKCLTSHQLQLNLVLQPNVSIVAQ